ncbi:MAG: hypothetical protein KF773_33450 [Deltaproteobacteria bacterium]|nr:hypothetical protein [Deltaproteobacteria bacterium]MCW5807624.1 hypothetical protein [Deltaproteobacteria bacterium]
MTKTWLFAMALCAGCGAAATSARESLDESIRSYNEGVRWGRYAMAAARLPMQARSHFVEEMDKRAEEVRITDYEIVTVDAKGPREARVHVKMSWYRDDEQILHQTHAVQTWERTGKTWLMVDESKLRGPDLPGLADRGASTEPNPL